MYTLSIKYVRYMSCDVDMGRWYMFFLILKEKSTSGHEHFNIVCCTILSFTLESKHVTIRWSDGEDNTMYNNEHCKWF